MLVTYHIKVDNGGNATVTREPMFKKLHVSEKDEVQFRSNDPKTVIQYRATSPFEENAVGPRTILPIGSGNGKGPYRVLNPNDPNSPHHSDCRFITPADV